MRIVTLAPALTEIVFALGKGEWIVGNTKFCDFPREARNTEKVGGILDLNLEKLISLRPNIVLFYPEMSEVVGNLPSSIKKVELKHRRLQELFHSIQVISEILSAPENGVQLKQKIQISLNEVRRKAGTKTDRSCLIVAGRTREDLRQLIIIGNNDFLSEILTISGGKNAYRGNIPYPSMSMESLVSLNPQVVFEISALFENIDRKKLLRLWAEYPMISAVKNNRIHLISNDSWLRPGPRVGLIAGEMYSLIHAD